jgi:hypothetical protein
MKVQFLLNSKDKYNGKCTITKEAGDEKFYSESVLLYHVKNILNKDGHDLIKKVMSKDGHMVGGDTYPYYLRDRKSKYCIYDPNYCLRSIAEDFNERGVVELEIWDMRKNGDC